MTPPQPQPHTHPTFHLGPSLALRATLYHSRLRPAKLYRDTDRKYFVLFLLSALSFFSFPVLICSPPTPTPTPTHPKSSTVT